MPPNSMQWSGVLTSHTDLPAAFTHSMTMIQGQGYVNRLGTDKLFRSDLLRNTICSLIYLL